MDTGPKTKTKQKNKMAVGRQPDQIKWRNCGEGTYKVTYISTVYRGLYLRLIALSLSLSRSLSLSLPSFPYLPLFLLLSTHSSSSMIDGGV